MYYIYIFYFELNQPIYNIIIQYIYDYKTFDFYNAFYNDLFFLIETTLRMIYFSTESPHCV